MRLRERVSTAGLCAAVSLSAGSTMTICLGYIATALLNPVAAVAIILWGLGVTVCSVGYAVVESLRLTKSAREDVRSAHQRLFDKMKGKR